MSSADPADSTISLADEASLSWYFGPGLSVYDKSTFGAILAKLDRDGFGSERCDRCNGGGILEDGGFAMADECRSCDGKGRIAGGQAWCHDCGGFCVVVPYEVRAEHGGWCPDCKGTGATPVDRRPMARTPCEVCGGKGRGRGKWADPRDRAKCSHCYGSGYEPITAKPIHGSEEPAGVQADDMALTRFAITSRRVEAVRAMSPALAVALGVYYGDIGERWAITERGRMFSLFHLVPAGRKLARWGEKAGAGADLGLTAQERIGTQAALEAEQPKRERFALLAAAATQAGELYGRAARAWNKQNGAHRDQDDVQRLAKALARLGHPELAADLRKRASGL